MPTTARPARPWALAAWVCAPLLALYLLTLPPGVTLADAGLFAMTCAAGGINHPPGYPLYSVICPAFAHLPGIEPAIGLGALSALFAAIAAAVLARVIERLGVPRAYAVAGALCYGASLAYWSQAIIPEVYSLNVLLVLATWLGLQRALEQPDPARLALLGAAIGLGLANHWPLMLASGPGLAVLAFTRPSRALAIMQQGKAWIAGLAGLALGLLPYVYMYVRLQQPAAISLLPPAEDFQDFLLYVLRSGYSDVDDSPLADAGDQRAYLGWLGREAVRQMGVGMVPIIAAGAVHFARAPLTLLALVALALCNTVVLALMVNFPFDYRWQAIFRPYPLVGWATLGVLAAGGLAALGAGLDRAVGSRWVGRLAALLLPPVVALAQLDYNDRSDDDLGERVAMTLLKSLPPRATLFTTTDEYTGTLGYLHTQRGVRPDLRLLESQGLVFADRAVPLTGDRARRVAAVDALVRTSERPVFYLQHVPHGTAVVGYGVMRRLLPTTASRPTHPCKAPATQVALGLALLEAQPVHPLERWLRQSYLLDLTGCVLARADEARWRAILAKLQQSHQVALYSLDHLLGRPASAARDREIQRLRAQLEARPADDLTKSQQAWRHAMLGRAALAGAQPNLPAAESHLRRSLGILDRSWHTARRGLAELLRMRGDRVALKRLLARYPDDAALDPWRARRKGSAR